MKAEKVAFTIRKIKPFLSDGLLFIKGTNLKSQQNDYLLWFLSPFKNSKSFVFFFNSLIPTFGLN